MTIFHLISGRIWSGVNGYALTLATEQRADGHHVEIISANRPRLTSRFTDAGFKVTTMQIHGHFNPVSPLRLAWMLRRCPADTVIHVHRVDDLPLVARALRLLPAARRPRFVLTQHLARTAPLGRKFRLPYSLLDRIIFVSARSRELFLSSAPAIDPAKLTVIHNSIITPSVAQSADDEEPPTATDRPFRILYLGRIHPEKGLDTAIQALQQLPEAVLTVCGTGDDSYTASLQRLASRLGVHNRIRWAGFTDCPTPFITATHIGILPSRCEEACALANFEFMSAGKPMVTSSLGAQPEIITDGVDGLLVAPDDPAALAAAIRRLIDEPELLARMGEAARHTFATRFDYASFYNKIMRAYL